MTAAGAPTAHWSYLYTMYLVIVYAIFGPNPLAARLIQALVVGLLHPFLVYRLTQQIINPLTEKYTDFSGRLRQRVPLIAAGVTAVYTYFIYYTVTLMTEPFYITGVLTTLLLTILLTNHPTGLRSRKIAILLGIAISATVLLRQVFLIFLPILFGWLLLSTFRRYSWRDILSAISASFVVVVIAILPITIFNYTRFGQFVLLNTNTGYAFYWANHPFYGTQFKPASEMGTTYQDLVPAELRRLDEAALDRELLKRGLMFVLDDPKRYLQLSLSRVPEYFKFWPDPASSQISNLSRISSFGILFPFMLFGLLFPKIKIGLSADERILIHPSRSIVLLYLFIAVYTAIHLLTWAQIRYRLPVDAILIPFSAFAFSNIGELIRQSVHHKRIVFIRER
jgi:4-amino-4-deoxy-L-arabinose transferase-like glycosyltransferase